MSDIQRKIFGTEPIYFTKRCAKPPKHFQTICHYCFLKCLLHPQGVGTRSSGVHNSGYQLVSWFMSGRNTKIAPKRLQINPDLPTRSTLQNNTSVEFNAWPWSSIKAGHMVAFSVLEWLLQLLTWPTTWCFKTKGDWAWDSARNFQL